MPEDKVAESFRHADQCDLCIVMGSSLVVYPAAAIPERAKDSGAKLMIVNRDETPLDHRADLVIHESVSEVLGVIMDKLT
jgi:NAD-dependent deacetylase